ncbi:MAG: transglutaminase family protein [Cyclobacteriaceae bacterium]|nr:transglutaminase family protein [Cyclobacteriaceae bacterium]
MSKFKIRHITRYSYEGYVRDSANQIMLYPLEDDFQEILQHVIVVSANPMIHIHVDYYGNKVGTFTNAQAHNELVIDSQLVVITKNRFMPEETEPAEKQWNDLRNLALNLEYIDFLRQERFHSFEELGKIISAERSKNLTPLESAKNFCQYVFDTFLYRKGITTVETTVDEIWEIKSGVCQDFAHILLVMLRLISIPSRYVSGYICPNKSGMRGEGATHAWVEAYIPFYGWIGLDPTNNCVVNETHVRLAVGKNFSDCSPVKGTYRGSSNHTLEVAVSVSYEDGLVSNQENEIVYSTPTTSSYSNSFRKHQEMQMQQ